MSEGEQASASLLHAPVGAYLARDAVWRDRRGGAGRDTVSYDWAAGHGAAEAIINLADMIEPYRADFDGLAQLRRLAAARSVRGAGTWG